MTSSAATRRLREGYQDRFYALVGGTDLVTPALAVPPGRSIGSINYESVVDGYARVDGYERCDGRALASSASYLYVKFKTGTVTIAAGATVTGHTSGATGKALADVVITSGTFGGGDAKGGLALGQVTGTFVADELLYVAAAPHATVDGAPIERGAPDDTTDATYLQAAIVALRALILVVPGEGNIRGVWPFNGDKYAVRDEAGGATAALFKASAAGWVKQDLGRQLRFVLGGGVHTIVEGDIITGNTSAAVATVKRIVKVQGDWQSASVAGRLILANQVGTFVAETIKVGALTCGTIAGDSSALTLRPGGRFRFVSHNFFGASNLRRMYAVDGVGPGWEYDGTVFVPILTGMQKSGPDLVTNGSLDLPFNATSGTTGWTATRGALSISGGTVLRLTQNAASGQAIWTMTTVANTWYSVNVVNAAVSNKSALCSIGTTSGGGELVPAQAIPVSATPTPLYFKATGTTTYLTLGIIGGVNTDTADFSLASVKLFGDCPVRLAPNFEHLFFAFPGGSLQFSGPGAPYAWSLVLGAGEIGMGADITDLIPEYADTMTVLTQTKVGVLYGTDAATFQLKNLSADAGAFAHTAQKMDTPLYLDNRGVRSQATTQAFGDFNIGTITALIEPQLKIYRKNTVTPVGSIRSRTKGHYRLFFSDMSGLCIFIGRKQPECMFFKLNHLVTAVGADEQPDGTECLMMGSTDGYVYLLDSGTSFDGASVSAYCRLAFNHVGSPRVNKVWKNIIFELRGTTNNAIGVSADFDYGNPDGVPENETSLDVQGGGGFWNEANWNEVYWSAPFQGIAFAPIDGFGANFSPVMISDAIYEDPHTINGYTVQFLYRGVKRDA